MTRLKNAAAPPPNGGADNTHFIARNFLIEEHLDPSRVESYAAKLPPAGVSDFKEWNAAHETYLRSQVQRKPPGKHDYRHVERGDPAVCPETFCADTALLAFKGIDLKTFFIRLVPVTDIARFYGDVTREMEEHIYSLGQKVAADPDADTPERQELSLILDEAYNRCDHRPVFAAFYDDFVNDLRDPSDPAWPNRVRDRLGLYRVSQLSNRRPPHRVFLFRYPVEDIPRLKNPVEDITRRRVSLDQRLLAVPCVLDQGLYEAFCPSPRELDKGRLLNLQTDSFEGPAREVLHLFMPMRAERLFRVGLVTAPVPENLAPSRRDHLIWVRMEAEREDYAYDTDGDLF